MNEELSESTVAAEYAFWLAHLQLGWLMFASEALAGLVYFRLTPGGPNRLLLSWMALVTMTVGTAALALTPLVAGRRWRSRFALTSTLLAGALLGVCAHLDGGVASPLLMLVILPLALASFVFRPVEVGAAALAALVEVVAVVSTDPDIQVPWPNLIVTISAISGLGAMAIVSCVNRVRLQRAEDELSTRLEEAATHDGLTGCLNHRAFNDALAVEAAAAQRYHRPLSLLVADVDGFKAINDRLGHATGDDVLAAVGATLRAEVRGSDVVGRIGGDEFSVLMRQTGASGAHAQAERLRAAAAHSHPALHGISVGVATLELDDPDGGRLFHEADRDMYRNKRRARTTPSALAPTHRATGRSSARH